MPSPVTNYFHSKCLFKSLACIALALTATFAVSAASTTNEDWPRFLGPHRNNTSDESGLLDRWPADGPPLIWEKAVGSGYSTPSVRDGLLVLHHRLKDDEIVEAMHAATGKTRWQHKDPSHFRDRSDTSLSKARSG